MFGINEKGETASIIINDYKPFFYLKVNDDWSDADTTVLKQDVHKSCFNAIQSIKLR